MAYSAGGQGLDGRPYSGVLSEISGELLSEVARCSLMGSFNDSRLVGGKIKEVIELASGKGFHSPNNEFLVDGALAFAYTVNLASRYLHSFSQLSQVPEFTVAEFEDSCLDYHKRSLRDRCLYSRNIFAICQDNVSVGCIR